MITSISKPSSVPARVVHWVGCLLGTALVLMFAMFAFGGHEAPPPLSLQMASLVLALIGYLLGWWNDLAGGIVSLVGMVGFYALNYAAAGNFPEGWVFPLCFVPGVLMVIAGLLKRANRP
jgi:hypothetical protein